MIDKKPLDLQFSQILIESQAASYSCTAQEWRQRLTCEVSGVSAEVDVMISAEGWCSIC